MTRSARSVEKNTYSMQKAMFALRYAKVHANNAMKAFRTIVYPVFKDTG